MKLGAKSKIYQLDDFHFFSKNARFRYVNEASVIEFFIKIKVY